MSLSKSPVAADEDSDPSIEMEVEEDPEEEEYEEVEVEEEVEEEEEEKGEEEEEDEEDKGEEGEEEEEVEVEEEEEEEVEEEEGDDKFDVSEPPADAAKDPEDLSQHMESEGQERNLRLVSSVAVNPDTLSSENNDSYKVLKMEKGDFQLEHVTRSSPNSRNDVDTGEDDKQQGLDVANENRGSPLQCKTFEAYDDPSCDSKAYLCVKESGIVKSSSDTEKDVAVDIQQKCCSVEDAYVGTQNSINQIKQLDVHLGDETKQMTSRFTSPDMRTQSLSPSAEMKDVNKRPAIICSFFAKGWCIRGSSCRFLHIKDHVNNSGQQAEGDLVSTNCKRERQLEEGLRGNAETSGMSDAPVPLAASLVSSSLHSSEFSVKETIQDEQEASPSQHPSQDKQKFPLLSKEDLSSKNHVSPTGRDSSISRDHLILENRSIFNASNNYFSRNLSYPSCVEELAPIENQQLYSKYASQVSAPSSYSMSSNLSNAASALDAQKLLKNGKEHHVPRSTFLGSEWEELPLTSSCGVRPHAAGYKRKISSYDWEPSVPFRPSFFITSASISSSGDMYDPFHPCVEITNIGDGSLKASIFIHGPPIQASSQVRTYGDCAVAGDKVADINDDKSSVSSHHRFYENEADKSCVPSEKDDCAHETARTYLNSRNGKASIGENTVAVEDNTKNEVEQIENDARYRGEGSEPKKRRAYRAKKNNEINVDFQMDGNMRNDSKALKIFRTALVDLVKELLKPSWQEGHLSKDAHNTIVKKSVDKVISTLQPHQIPITIDAVNHYVSSSRLKIAKLVDGYVNKYSKS